ncbi:D-tyrosyl-tRNA(Tyr) deacylase [Nocardioides sp. zg-536]|uniref:D-aminoacyl-tRNA deacylase n=1 Tax=Nocardioides faecalis TaxID=2803858 RepID=A0A939BWH1_9ACTN|nr:D-aminoacyl-tRNA deacylase [Nocardioides faecalis]MBM9458398.1 D-tyrosyl-tRNA(Tyr) deacylase [Nocardioides faecalis]QVI58417.1 D-tyrosyl-tRNA(Tyr) deacylase [Nocardioides faecalis]
MRAVLQRVTSASVVVGGEVVGAIESPGLLVYLGITHDDGNLEVAWMARKIRDLRIMPDEKSVAELGAPVLVVSQFTLYGDARKGRRPTWVAAAPGEVSEPLYEAVCAALKAAGTHVERGVFGADMAVASINDGPFTVVIDTP